jgi:hypothetical protein
LPWRDGQTHKVFALGKARFEELHKKMNALQESATEFLAVSMEPRETVRKSDATRNWAEAAEARKKLESHSMELQFFRLRHFSENADFRFFAKAVPENYIYMEKKNSRKRRQQHQASKQQHNHNKRCLLLDDVVSSAHSFPLFSGCWRSGFLRTRFP